MTMNNLLFVLPISDPEDTSGKELKEYTRKFFKGFRAMLQKQGYPTEENRATVSSSAITPCEKAKGLS